MFSSQDDYIATFSHNGQRHKIRVTDFSTEYAFSEDHLRARLEGYLIEDPEDISNDTKEKKTMGTLRQDIHNIELDEDTKLLRDASIEDDEGYITEEGTEILLDILYKDNRQAVIDAVKKVEYQES